MSSRHMIPAVLGLVLTLSACGAETGKTGASQAPAASVPTLAELPAPYNEASLTTGKALFGRKCASCHNIQLNKGNLVGPNLHGLFERGTAKAPNYSYSPALRDFTHKQWSPDLINQWLLAPQSFVPGSAMYFNGIKDETERRDLIAYLLIASRED